LSISQTEQYPDKNEASENNADYTVRNRGVEAGADYIAAEILK
jgi:hypothetical protein